MNGHGFCLVNGHSGMEVQIVTESDAEMVDPCGFRSSLCFWNVRSANLSRDSHCSPQEQIETNDVEIMVVRSGTCLDLVDITYSMIELNGPSFGINVCLLGSSAVQNLSCGWSRSVRIARDRSMGCCRGVRRRWLSPLLDWTVAVECRALSRSLRHGTVTALRWCAELGLWALDAVKGSLPVRRTLRLFGEPLIRSRRWSLGRFHLNSRSGPNRVNGGTRRRRHANAVGVVFKTALDSVPGRQECVESLDQIRMAGEELGYATNHTGRVDAIESQ